MEWIHIIGILSRPYLLTSVMWDRMGVVRLMFSLITRLFVVLILTHSLGRVYGMSMLQGRCLLFVWTSAWSKILTNDDDAVCVSVLVKWWIIYCSILTLLMLCGVKYLRCLRFSG